MATATAEPNAAAAAANGAVAASALSTVELAGRISSARQTPNPASAAPAKPTEGTPAGAAAPPNPQPAAPDPAVAEAAVANARAEEERLAALTPEERAAEEAEAQRVASLTPEQLAAEQAAAAAAAAAGEEETLDLTQDTRLTPEQKQYVGELFRERIGKAKAKYLGDAEALVATERTARETAEAEAATLRAQLEQKPNVVALPDPNDPLAQLTTPAQVQTAVQNAHQVKTWAARCLRQLNRAGGPEAVAAELAAAKIQLPDNSAEALEEWLLNAQDRAEQTITFDAPRRVQFLQAEAAANTTAEREFPFLKAQTTDVDKVKYADAMAILKDVPWIKQLPNWKVAVGVYAEGMQVVRARLAARKPGAAAPAKPKPVPARVPVRPASVPAAAAPAKVQASTAAKTFRESGSVNSLAAMFAAQRAAA